jgi:hypothetical protein
VLYGDDRLVTRHDDRFNGLRVYFGYWLDDAQTLCVEGSAFFLERDSTHFKATSDGSQVLARPFINALVGSPASEVIAGPSQFGPRDGQFVGYSRIELFGEEANFKTPLFTSECGRVELLIGARFLQMRDRVDLAATGHPLANPSTLLGLTDHIRVEDHFYGGNLGLTSEWTRGRWELCLTGEVAPGVTDAPVRAFGDRLFQTPTQRVMVPYGLAVAVGGRHLPASLGRQPCSVSRSRGYRHVYRREQTIDSPLHRGSCQHGKRGRPGPVRFAALHRSG